MTRASASELRRQRLGAQLIATASAASVTDAARRLLAVQAQDLGQARWALGVRTADARGSDVDAALASGELVRSWPMRGTLMLTAAEDLRWLLGLTAERQLRAQTTRRVRNLELDDATVERARRVAVGMLSGGGSADRAGMLAAFGSAGIGVDGGRGYHLILHLCQSGTLVWGPGVGVAQHLVLLDEWVPRAAPLPREEALARLAHRYLAGHGPAAAEDLAWWSGLPLGQVRRGLVAAGAHELTTAERPLYTLEVAAADTAGAAVVLLPGFDEYLLGYQRRELIVEPAGLARLVPGGNGVFAPFLVGDDGRVIGVWRRGRDGSVAVERFAGASVDTDALAAALGRLGAFTGMPAPLAS